MWALKVGLNPGAPQGGSGEQYFLGDFDGKQFTSSSEAGSHGWTNYGKDDYCAISFNGIPKSEKPVLIGWMSNWQYASKVPTSPWRGQMSLPRRLSLLNDAAGLALVQEPVTAPLRGDHSDISTVNGGKLSGTVCKKLLSSWTYTLAGHRKRSLAYVFTPTNNTGQRSALIRRRGSSTSTVQNRGW